MTIERIDLEILRLPYVHFFETSFGRSYDRTFILVRVHAGGISGLGEVVAEEAPLYSSETTETAWHVLRDFLVPLVFKEGISDPAAFARAAKTYRGHPMAKAGLELALWDLKAKAEGLPLTALWGGTKAEIAAGVSCGIEDTFDDLVARVGGYLSEGYRRIKIKIKPGWDVEACAAVRRAYPEIALQVDANGAYVPADIPHLKKLDAFNLVMVEQPFPPYDLWDHAGLQEEMKTPLCLDESIVSETSARQALEMGSCRIVNIKVGRVGGPLEAKRIHDFCQARGVPVWCGGMLESGIGRAANLHLASLPNFELPNDLSASNRYWKEDLIDPEIVLEKGGVIKVPTGPGIGVRPVEERIRKAAVRRESFEVPSRR
ncbi:MAG: o-succinylbenzoate synthase [Candidatus Aminicenantes bacterium]|nr:o-succinylbenzoate synthase [Candidatus Aminicenantes bacterium]